MKPLDVKRANAPRLSKITRIFARDFSFHFYTGVTLIYHRINNDLSAIFVESGERFNCAAHGSGAARRPCSVKHGCNSGGRDEVTFAIPELIGTENRASRPFQFARSPRAFNQKARAPHGSACVGPLLIAIRFYPDWSVTGFHAIREPIVRGWIVSSIKPPAANRQRYSRAVIKRMFVRFWACTKDQIISLLNSLLYMSGMCLFVLYIYYTMLYTPHALLASLSQSNSWW